MARDVTLTDLAEYVASNTLIDRGGLSVRRGEHGVLVLWYAPPKALDEEKQSKLAARIIMTAAAFRTEHNPFVPIHLHVIIQEPFRPDLESFRAGGDVRCLACDRKYYEHPVHRVGQDFDMADLSPDEPSWEGLEYHRLCNGQLAKL